ncbi:uncharacterized protein N7473_010338 [Penicillium subrubescens]|uniref:uncharacterized protein n=1 Tax=Penicillium subrubescens TaxID=1316194 RepID=UPI0025453C9F|nr:uncharacterized protein N7473_010338 [Penicillium subrubescens]KAJ5883452.1 hypothetical protein N7473_010338 [Penicillium subrubescens]
MICFSAVSLQSLLSTCTWSILFSPIGCTSCPINEDGIDRNPQQPTPDPTASYTRPKALEYKSKPNTIQESSLPTSLSSQLLPRNPSVPGYASPSVYGDNISKRAHPQLMVSSTSGTINPAKSPRVTVPTRPRTKSQHEPIGYYNNIGPSEGSEIWRIGEHYSWPRKEDQS